MLNTQANKEKNGNKKLAKIDQIYKQTFLHQNANKFSEMCKKNLTSK